MIKMNSISAIVCYVKDLDKTAKFYEAVGFRPTERDNKSFKVYLNWFSIQFRLSDTPLDNSKIGSYTYIKVDNVDEYYQFVLSKGLKPDAEPINEPSGNRVFALTDLDGYKLAFFNKK